MNLPQRRENPMDFDFSGEQDQIRSTLRAYLASNCTFAQLIAAREAGEDFAAALWQDLASRLGVLGASLPERVGGFGGTPVDVMVMMEELGERLAPVPFIDTIVIAAHLLAAAGDRDEAVAEIIAGTERYAFAWAEPNGRFRVDHVHTSAIRSGNGWIVDGSKTVVSGAPHASRFLVTARTAGKPDACDGISLFAVDPSLAGVDLRAYPTIDGRWAADIRFDKVQLPPSALVGDEGEALPRIEEARDAAIAALGAEAVGVMRKLLQDTIDYTRERRQFGQAISSFQALQHRMVDMFMQLELATSAVYKATLSLGGDPRERAMAASAAKVTVGNACRFIGQNAVQLHGGMGMTDELAVGHYFKRATVIETEYGSVDYHVARFAELSGQR